MPSPQAVAPVPVPSAPGTTVLTVTPPPPQPAPPPADGGGAPTTPAVPPGTTPGAPPPAGDKPPRPDDETTDPGRAAAPLSVADLKLPEGLRVDEKALSDILPLADKLGLKAEQLAGLVEHVARRDAAAVERIHADWVKQLEPLKADQPFAQRAMRNFGTPELTSWLDSTGLGNFPPLVKVFAAIGKAMAEDKIAGATSGSGAGTLTPAEKTAADLRARYPKMHEQLGL